MSYKDDVELFVWNIIVVAGVSIHNNYNSFLDLLCLGPIK